MNRPRALCTSISEGEATDTAHDLPAKFGKILTEEFDGDEFIDRAGVDDATAESSVTTGMDILESVVPNREVEPQSFQPTSWSCCHRRFEPGSPRRFGLLDPRQLSCCRHIYATMSPRGNPAAWQEPEAIEHAVEEVEGRSRPLDGPGDLDGLVDYLADRQFVLLGEASHGTSEFYRWRAQLSARLIEEHGFDFVAVEGDWPSCYILNRFVKGRPDAPKTVREALETFTRWPTWMWANWETVEFFEWLALHNREFEDDPAGFYGLDVYSLFESMDAVVEHLEATDPGAVEFARDAYRCFEPYGEDAREYGRSTRLVPETCEDEVVDVLTRLREEAPTYDGDESPDEQFNVEQNARVARNAEEYYRSLAGSGNSWNVRDRHMADTLDRLIEQHGDDATAIVWAHNTHIGDARATDMAQRGRLNIGQLVRERYPPKEVALVGFGSHHGSVIAADEWGAEMESMRVPEAMEGSYEDVFHRAGGEDRLLFTGRIAAGDALAEERGHRAIGVVYHPSLESGNYVPTELRERYDAFIHIDESGSLHPLDLHPDREQVPELYPFGR
ncbi:MAG: erythromycin esterase family protein [Halolamina sp.]